LTSIRSSAGHWNAATEIRNLQHTEIGR
jgi:hypothetical protein